MLHATACRAERDGGSDGPHSGRLDLRSNGFEFPDGPDDEPDEDEDGDEDEDESSEDTESIFQRRLVDLHPVHRLAVRQVRPRQPTASGLHCLRRVRMR